jgi:hypothetical protein
MKKGSTNADLGRINDLMVSNFTRFSNVLFVYFNQPSLKIKFALKLTPNPILIERIDGMCSLKKFVGTISCLVKS